MAPARRIDLISASREESQSSMSALAIWRQLPSKTLSKALGTEPGVLLPGAVKGSAQERENSPHSSPMIRRRDFAEWTTSLIESNV
jgi:hypothetical protein